MRREKLDKVFLSSVLILVIAGFTIFSSASLGLLAKEGPRFSSVAFNQVFFGLILGLIAFFIISKIHFLFWRKYAFYIYLASLIFTLLVFIPGLGFEHGGARRWITLFGFSIQPAEFLKVGFVIYFATWLSSARRKISEFKYGLLPLIVLLGITGAVLLAQPDTDTFVVIVVAGLSMFIIAGARFRDIGIIILIGLLGIGALSLTRPYVMARMLTFLDPSRDPLGAGYQIQQSLIAVGSGKITGRGFGQSVQKFNFLPEPIGDSIFAVAAEEFGFIGSVLMIGFFIFFATRGLKIAAKAANPFATFVATGIIVLIICQTFINIGAMLGILPLSGIPLPFVSHGGTALFFTLAEIGIILNISKYKQES